MLKISINFKSFFSFLILLDKVTYKYNVFRLNPLHFLSPTDNLPHPPNIKCYIFIFKFYLFIFMCIGILPTCMSTYCIIPYAQGGQKRKSDAL